MSKPRPGCVISISPSACTEPWSDFPPPTVPIRHSPARTSFRCLRLGRTQQDYSQATNTGGANLGEATGNAVIGAAINQLVSNRVSRLFGVSAIRINPAVGGVDNNPNARLTVEQQVSSNVTITYITNLARSAQQVLELEYNIARDYTINAMRDENGVVSFDLLIRKRKK